MPAPGWTGEYDWTGFIPFDRMPSATNPPSGHFVSANNKIVPDSYPYFISRDWDLPNRAERIEALLAQTPVQTPASSAAIQADTLSLMAQRLTPLMTAIAPAGAEAHEAVERLRHWDFHMDRDKVEPLLFTAWLREFSRAILFGRFGNAVDGLLGLEAAGHGGGLDPAARLVRGPEGAGHRDLRGSARSLARRRSVRTAASLRSGHERVALGSSACRRIRQSRLPPHPVIARLARRLDPGFGRL